MSWAYATVKIVKELAATIASVVVTTLITVHLKPRSVLPNAICREPDWLLREFRIPMKANILIRMATSGNFGYMTSTTVSENVNKAA